MKKKSLITLISVTLVMVVAIAGTLAWLTDRESVTNVFTVGDIDITLDETLLDEDGEPVIKEGEVVKTDKGNEYHLIPGETYTKDPTITVEKGGEPSYVRMLVKVNCVSALDEIFKNHKDDKVTIESIFTGYNAEEWSFIDDYINTEKDSEGNDVEKRVYEFRYIGALADKDTHIVQTLTDDTRLAPLFTELKVPGVLTKEELKTLVKLTIEVEGHAIQAAAFEADTVNNKTAEQVAWDAFDAQYAEK